MRAAAHTGPSQVGVRDVADPEVVNPTDVVVRIVFAGICGSDLWPYRGVVPHSDWGSGHEFIGVVADVGAEVRRVRPGQPVIAPFLFSDGECELCRDGLQPLCAHAGIWGKDWAGAQAQAIRVPFADAVLVPVPWPESEIDTDLARRLIPLCDVFATGTHGAVLAGVAEGDVVVVVGDGAVGISAAMASLRRGAAQVLVVGENPKRLAVAERAGARTLRVRRGASAVESVRAALGGRLADRVVECVGMQDAFSTALDVVRPAGSVGFVGVPHAVDPIPPTRIFDKQIRLAGGVAPARHYLEGLLAEVSEGRLDPSLLVDSVFSLEEVAEGYKAMDTSSALKVILDVRHG
jgi:threonine dehydrogenase-like Zn-dependent dehydrogenase